MIIITKRTYNCALSLVRKEKGKIDAYIMWEIIWSVGGGGGDGVGLWVGLVLWGGAQRNICQVLNLY